MAIASLAALEKWRLEDRSFEIHVTPDGINDVDVNSQIRVRDAGLSPTAHDVAATPRNQAHTGVPHLGPTAHVSEAHRAVAVNPRGWGDFACQVIPGRPVSLNKHVTSRVVSAANW